MTDKTDKMVAETKAMRIHPWWHTAVYLVLFAILAAFTYSVLDDLTDRINSANERADVNEAGVAALADQVEGLGGTPVVTPEDLPEAGADGLPGNDGDDGADGADGADGTNGVDGVDGTDGTDGDPGATGASGTDGGAGASGTPGEPGAPGSDGAAGAMGEPGPAGPQGEPGPAGPQGETGATGPAGQDGETGATGETGPAGQTCPDGYTLAERTIFTAESPLGEPGFVCVADADENTTPVRN